MMQQVPSSPDPDQGSIAVSPPVTRLKTKVPLAGLENSFQNVTPATQEMPKADALQTLPLPPDNSPKEQLPFHHPVLEKGPGARTESKSEDSPTSDSQHRISARNVDSVEHLDPVIQAPATDAFPLQPAGSSVALRVGVLELPSEPHVVHTDQNVMGAATLPDNTSESAALPDIGMNVAKLVQGINHSEFRIGMQSEEFGKIDIRTNLARNEVTARISVEHSAIAKVLAAELPALYDRLSEHRIHTAEISVQQQASAMSSNNAGGGTQQRDFRTPPVIPSRAAVRQPVSRPVAAGEISDRIDIHV